MLRHTMSLQRSVHNASLLSFVQETSKPPAQFQGFSRLRKLQPHWPHLSFGRRSQHLRPLNAASAIPGAIYHQEEGVSAESPLDETGLVAWLEQQDHVNNRRLLAVGWGPQGRGLFAAAEIAEGHPVLQHHRDQVITRRCLALEVAALVPESTSEWARLALFLLMETHAAADSPWAPYVMTLPAPGSLHSTVFWTAEERSFLPPLVLRDTEERCRLIQSEYLAVWPAIRTCSKLFGGPVSLQQFTHAYALVCSRAWRIDQLDALVLVPFVDLLNHDPRSQTLLCYDEDLECVEVVAERDLAAGSQALISYGELSNAVLALDFGFAVAGNPHDTVELTMHVSPSDELGGAQQALLRHHGLLGAPPATSASFQLRHAGPPAGRGQGLPHTLRAWARVMAAAGEGDLAALAEAAARNDGRLARRPLRGENCEARAMSVLQAAVEEEVVSKEHAMQALEAAVGEGRIHEERARILRTLHGSQLEVLQSVAAWIRPRALGGGLQDVLVPA